MPVVFMCQQVPSEHIADTMVIYTHNDETKVKGPFCKQCASEFEELHTGRTTYNPTGDVYSFKRVPLPQYLEENPEALQNYLFKEIR